MNRRTAKKVALIGVSFVLASAVSTPYAAFADDPIEQTGSGKSDLYIKLSDTSEHGGTSDPTNPDRGDGFGENIAFSVPSKINFTIKSNGELITPDANVVYIENESVYGIHASSLEASAEQGWNIVSDAAAVADDGTDNTKNNIDIQVTPNATASGKINISDYTTKAALPSDNSWNMSAGAESNTIVTDRVQMKFEGDVSHISKDVNNATKLGTLGWYMTPGRIS